MSIITEDDERIQYFLKKIDELPMKPVAVQALWDGDTYGWWLGFEAILSQPSRAHPQYTVVFLGGIAEKGGDIRLFTGEVPPWPEAEFGRALGEILSERGVEFYFPSPYEPEDNCPPWWEKDDHLHCKICNMPLMQDPSHPNYGICSICYRKQRYG
jgi:hypothetical protein